MKENISHVAMRRGLVIGALFATNFIFSTIQNPILGLLSYFITALIIYFSYRFTVDFRDKQNNGVLSFGKGLLFVSLLFLFASIISAGVKYVYTEFISTNYLSQLYDQTMLMMETIMPSVSEEMYDAYESFLTPINFTMMITWMNLFFGFFLGIIISLATKRSNK